MTTTTTPHPASRTRHVITAFVTGAASVGLTAGLTLALTSGGSSTALSRPAVASAPVATASASVGTVNSGPDNPWAGSTVCAEFATATPGSPAAFRLADTITEQGPC